MKAKRIRAFLSMLIAVLMLASTAVTAFAAQQGEEAFSETEGETQPADRQTDEALTYLTDSETSSLHAEEESSQQSDETTMQENTDEATSQGQIDADAYIEQSFVFCDIDMSGKVNSSDARAALRFAVGLEYYTRGHLEICGLKEKFSSSDARYILRIGVGLEESEIKEVTVRDDAFSEYVNMPAVSELFKWELPDAPEINAEPGTFTFTVYGYGHGVGLSQYGALSLEDGGYTYDRILAHYYTGTQIKNIEEVPETTLYPTLVPDEETGEEIFVSAEHPTEELLARIVYQEIYGITEHGKYKESLKALTVCVFSNLMCYDFDVKSRWDVGIASSYTYEELPENLKVTVKEVIGQYVAVKGDDAPVTAVYSALAAGMTASSEDTWGGHRSFLTSVPSPFDMKREGFISVYTYTVDEMRELITAYDESIVLEEDPAQWLKIIEHTGSMDETRGYVKKIKVGDRELSGYNEFHMGLMGNTHRSSCFTITYTP